VPKLRRYGALDIIHLAILIILLVALAVSVYRVIFLIRCLRLGKTDYRGGFGWVKGIDRRVISLVEYVLGQVKVYRGDLYAGISHSLIFWSFVLLLPEVFESVMMGVFPDFSLLRFMNSPLFYVYKFLQDFAGVMAIVGVAMAFYRRYVMRPLKIENTKEAFSILLLILLVILTMFGFSAASLSIHSDALMMPVSRLLAEALSGLSLNTRQTLYQLFMLIHNFVLLFFLSYLVFTRKHLHLLTAPLNVFLRSLKPVGEINYLDLDSEETFGAGKIEDLSWKHLLDLLCCTECGRCQELCPAHLTNKPLHPKKLILDLRENLILSGKAGKSKGPPLIGDDLPSIPAEAVWSCTTCAACVTRCPVFIEHFPKIIEIRRFLVLTEGKVPRDVIRVLRNLELFGNPWGAMEKYFNYPTEKKEKSDLLIFLGCSSLYNPRVARVSLSLCELLREAGIEFEIYEGGCCGDPARRLGNEYLYQLFVRKNVEKFNECRAKKIVTICPHCYNTIKHEYPQLGGVYEVIHHTDLIHQLLESGKLKTAKPLNWSVTYHDPCYLGRYNNMFDAPREILKSIKGLRLLEMERNRSNSLCCGGGGGRAWLEEQGQRICVERVREAAVLPIDKIVVACPLCLIMLGEGLKEIEKEETEVLDLCEIVKRSL